MKLKDYLLTLDAEARKRFMDELNFSPAYLYQLEKGIRKLSLTKARAVQDASGGAVTIRDLRPDILEQIEAA